MGERVVHIDGRETVIVEERIPLEELRLDPTNPRIQYQLDTSLVDGMPSQEALGLALAVANDQYGKLRENIEVNGGIMNPIWVAREGPVFTVIEGNTRLQCYLDLRDKYPHDLKWESIPAFVLPERCSRDQINFIRLEAHLFGTTPWDAYEKARELYRLNTEEDYSIERLASTTKLTRTEIQQHIQAYRDMRKYLEVYPEPGEHQKFSYFVEFRKSSELKRLVKEGLVSVVDFAEWVGEGKFRRGEDVRRLGPVLRDEAARQTLLDYDFDAALEQLAQVDPTANSPLFDKIRDVCQGLHSISHIDMDEMRRGQAPARVALLEELQKEVHSLMHSIQGH